jgi:acetylornithine/succinyldiaminopimelate/putrescine aminotransferase
VDRRRDRSCHRERAQACERLLAKGAAKETHHTVVRLAPPLVIAPRSLDWALDRFAEVPHELDGTGAAVTRGLTGRD